MTGTIDHTVTRAMPRGATLYACLMLVVAACGEPPTETGPFQIQIVSGDQQAAEVGSPLPSPLVIRVLQRGIGAGGVEVSWTAGELGGRVSPVATPSVTDSDGIAQVQRTLGSSVGPHRTTASIVTSPDVAVRFTSIAQISGAVHIARHPDESGSGQTDTVMARLRPYRVLVTDHLGQPVAGVGVRWYPDSAVTVSDARGIAAHAATLGVVPGPQGTSASVPGLLGSPVSFSAVALPGNPVALKVVEGNGQLGVTNQPLSPYRVEAVDMHDNAVAGVLVEWAIAAGEGTVDSPASVTASYPQAGMHRPAATAVHTLGAAEGAVTATATAPGLPGAPTATFTSTAVSAIVLVRPSGACSPWDYGPCVPDFEPNVADISPGGSVVWMWGYGTCDVTFEDDPEPPASAPLRSFGTHTRTFDAPGTFRYRCTAYSNGFATGMVGVINVR